MKSLLFFTLLFLFTFTSAITQTVDGSLSVNGKVRNYSIYVTSTYDEKTPNPLMLGLHPFNPVRWNAKAWRDTLIAFAEENGLILICPDAGSDGNIINDQTDTLLATALLDSALSWYNIDVKRVYVMGFSMGGLATYVYGLANPWRFGGYLPIGAAVSSTARFSNVLSNAAKKPFYVVHGSMDAPGTRYTPVVEALVDNQAIVDSILMTGVGHTIDFPNRNQILSTAYQWIDSVNTASVSSVDEKDMGDADHLQLFPNPIRSDQPAILCWSALDLPAAGRADQIIGTRILDLTGRVVEVVEVDLINSSSGLISPVELTPGLYLLVVEGNRGESMLRFIVQ
ncbi:MAG: hypothetical protein J4G05_11095 [Chlorobi bacterium]|nr:hypothetical protein [Chlorobiota bacterium]